MVCNDQRRHRETARCVLQLTVQGYNLLLLWLYHGSIITLGFTYFRILLAARVIQN